MQPQQSNASRRPIDVNTGSDRGAKPTVLVRSTSEERNNAVLEEGRIGRETTALESGTEGGGCSLAHVHLESCADADAENLQWFEARRIHSEPVELRGWVSADNACSLGLGDSESEEAEAEEEDDVFTRDDWGSWEGNESGYLGEEFSMSFIANYHIQVSLCFKICFAFTHSISRR